MWHMDISHSATLPQVPPPFFLPATLPSFPTHSSFAQRPAHAQGSTPVCAHKLRLTPSSLA